MKIHPQSINKHPRSQCKIIKTMRKTMKNPSLPTPQHVFQGQKDKFPSAAPTLGPGWGRSTHVVRVLGGRRSAQRGTTGGGRHLPAFGPRPERLPGWSRDDFGEFLGTFIPCHRLYGWCQKVVEKSRLRHKFEGEGKENSWVSIGLVHFWPAYMSLYENRVSQDPSNETHHFRLPYIRSRPNFWHIHPSYQVG